MLKRIIASAGELSSYIRYGILLCICLFLYDTYLVPADGATASALANTLMWVYRLLLYPFLLAGINGAIHEHLRSQAETGLGEFLANARRNYGRLFGANLAYTALFIVIIIAVTLASGGKQPDAVLRYMRYISIAVAPITLFWFAAIVAERSFFGSLAQGLKILLRNPFGLAIGITWVVACFADDAISQTLRDPSFLVVRVAETTALAALRILATVYFLALYRQIRGETLEPRPPDVTASLPEDKPAAAHEGLIRASFVFTFAAFLPLVHLVTLALGILALKRSKRFVLRSSIACCVGGFFTAFYLLLVAGIVVSGIAPSRTPTYAFLAEADHSLAPQVALLQQGSFREALKQLDVGSTSDPQRRWTADCALAIARWHAGNRNDALDSFYAAAQKQPERSEFYYYYGRALLDNDQGTLAAAQFRLAATHGPDLAQAARYTALVETAYSPTPLVSALLFIVVLLILFTLHEYGHAFAAWKLGDDTARNAGRLTLNPIKHLDLFGSILLPGILLWQQAHLLFGWAKPVPVNPQNFKNPQKDYMRVSFAGPAVNMLIAMVCFIVLGGVLLLLRLLWPETVTWHIADPYAAVSVVGPPFAAGLMVALTFLKELMYTSLTLGFFNLLPIPPLDGSWIVSGFLPPRLRIVFEQIRRFGFVLFLLLAMTPFVGYYLSVPTGFLWAGMQFVAATLGLG